MEGLGFPFRFITWIKACVSSPYYSILINGSLVGFFQGKRGLKQGVPLSLYLFTIIMEYLSRSLTKMALDPRFRFHQKCKKFGITHLCYADDLFLFCKVEDSSLGLLKSVIDHFKDVSGLEANPSKSQAFFGGISQWRKERLLQILEYTEGSLPVKYLGIPLNSKKLSVSN
eukprot:TRINITY_DN2079_c0_g1_i3.p1 TRINITY_DN2079_c0_g1~~TRINITY_DN2079_c0_g1_i3.p1  ORF type:complete len:171 (+),score=7.18 TRINITY_DN2079_c0_g1_i3:793-1305(+)